MLTIDFVVEAVLCKALFELCALQFPAFFQTRKLVYMEFQ